MPICTLGHKMDFRTSNPTTTTILYAGGYFCNDCGVSSSFSMSSPAYHCIRCQYDLCLQCASRQKIKKKTLEEQLKDANEQLQQQRSSNCTVSSNQLNGLSSHSKEVVNLEVRAKEMDKVNIQLQQKVADLHKRFDVRIACPQNHQMGMRIFRSGEDRPSGWQPPLYRCQLCRFQYGNNGSARREAIGYECPECYYTLCPSCAYAQTDLGMEEESSSAIRCEKRHSMKRLTSPPVASHSGYLHGFVCNECSKSSSYSLDTPGYHCPICLYDLCPKCVDKRLLVTRQNQRARNCSKRSVVRCAEGHELFFLQHHHADKKNRKKEWDEGDWSDEEQGEILRTKGKTTQQKEGRRSVICTHCKTINVGGERNNTSGYGCRQPTCSCRGPICLTCLGHLLTGQEAKGEGRLKPRPIETVEYTPSFVMDEPFPSSAEKVERKLDLCIACKERFKCVVFSPCFHTSCCRTCATKTTDCPICRIPVLNRYVIPK